MDKGARLGIFLSVRVPSSGGPFSGANEGLLATDSHQKASRPKLMIRWLSREESAEIPLGGSKWMTVAE